MATETFPKIIQLQNVYVIQFGVEPHAKQSRH